MNILFLVKEFPHSRVIGGPIIIYNRVKYLSARHDVSLLAFGEGYSEEEMESVSRYTRELVIVPNPGKRGVARKFLDFFSSPVPPYFLFHYSPRMYRELGRMVRSYRYDVVISEYSMVAQYLYRNPDLKGIKRVMSVHECYYLARRKALGVHGLSREGLACLYYLRGLKRFEFDMYQDADKVLTLTPEGRDELLSIRPQLDIAVVPHGVDVDTFRPFGRAEGPPTVMFLGNYPHDPNRDAVVFFAKEAWPAVKRELPEARFLVVGRGPTPDMLELSERDPSVEITGQVDDVRPYFARSHAFVCPVRMGGGFRGKVLEAMACGVPVVSTPLGAEGLPACDGENMILAESPGQLAEGTVRLLKETDLADRISRKARELVVRDYSWQGGVEILEEVLGQVVGG